MKINPITLDDEKRMNSHSFENLDISQLELLLQHNSTKHYKFIQNTSSNSTVLNTMSPVGEVDLVAVQKDNSGIQHLIRILQGEETLNHTVNLVSQFSQKLHKHIKRLEVNKSVLHRKFFNNSGLETHKQIVLAEKCMLDIVRTLHSNPPMQRQPGSKKMLYELRKRTYLPNLAIKVQETIEGCKFCAQSKRVINAQLKPPLQKIYDPSNGPEDIMEIDLVGSLPAYNGFTHTLTGIDVFSRYLFAVPVRKPDTTSIV